MCDLIWIGTYLRYEKLKMDIINMNDKCFELMIFFYILFFCFSPPIESGSAVSSGIKWFQLHPDRNCGESNRGPPYQVQGQSSLN
jgi:hypothetical protein